MSFTSHGKENTCLAAKTGTILHKKCFIIFSIVAHPDEYLHILLNIYLFIIYLNIYIFVIYIFNPCRWWRQWSSWGLYKCSNDSNSSDFFFGKDEDGLKILPRKIAGKTWKNASILCSSYCVIKLSSCGSVSNLSDFIFIFCVLTIKIQNQSFASLYWWMIELSICRYVGKYDLNSQNKKPKVHISILPMSLFTLNSVLLKQAKDHMWTNRIFDPELRNASEFKAQIYVDIFWIEGSAKCVWNQMLSWSHQ